MNIITKEDKRIIAIILMPLWLISLQVISAPALFFALIVGSWHIGSVLGRWTFDTEED